MKILDLTKIKIEEKPFKNYDISDSNFDFKDNLRLLVLTVRVSSGKSNISSIEISNDFKNSKFSFTYSGHKYDANVSLAGISISPFRIKLLIHNIVRQDIPNGKFKFALFNISNMILQNTKNML